MRALLIFPHSLGVLLHFIILILSAAGQQTDYTTGDCRIVETKIILGYDVSTNEPVFKSECTGACPEYKNSNKCQAQYKYVTVRSCPRWLDVEISTSDGVGVPETSYYIPPDFTLTYCALRTVRLVTRCDCNPAPCVINGGTTTVPHGAAAYSDCGERCWCRYGQLIECCRIRKSVTHMSFTERTRYINAYKGISSGDFGSALKTEYDNLIADHKAFGGSGIHTATKWFLPWHRNYVLLLENLLRKVDCRITVPYWASELYSVDPWGSILWSNGPTWFGTANAGGGCVPDGAFTSPWTTTPSDGSACLKRNRRGGVPTPNQWSTLLATPAGSFASFANTLNSYHGMVHINIGGTMQLPSTSANAPEFFLWHGQIDRYWYLWQLQSPVHAGSYHPATPVTETMAPGSLAGGKTILAFMKSGSQGDNKVCVTYQEPPSDPICKVIAALSKLPKSLLLSIPSASTASILAGARAWMQNFFSDNGEDSLDPDTLAELRGIPVSTVGSELPLGADLQDIREALYANITDSKSTDIKNALDALEEYELNQDWQQCENQKKCSSSCY